ncbi:uncharacterized protein BCR38DRAFT_482807 [Pseudomassariella vexata]|uniref:Uncharacterized protein n=1 Tax=Pseudomassariella vexata TaxID=1141098 RepID=A0A1Y2E6H2_9PEZI|nr:uncharacterized protein BCR38DRAFT_482807 [Pseudomassariella vexata]ORY67173.1 hypothetical protein BCR38DRAFT_482807 [Pseudomassariella vexata]
MLEQPSLRFYVLDIGPLGKIEPLFTFSNIGRALTVFDDIDDKEFIQIDEILYTSRFRPDFQMNKQFRRHEGGKYHIQMEMLSMSGPARLAIIQPGATSSLHFQQIREVSTSPPPGLIDVNLKAVSLNAKDIYTMGGHVETRTGTAVWPQPWGQPSAAFRWRMSCCHGP